MDHEVNTTPSEGPSSSSRAVASILARRDRAASRTSLIDRILANGQFVAQERAKVFSNGLSTDIMVFPPDLLPEHQASLDEKIKAATVYAAKFHDIDQLNALWHVPGRCPAEKLTERWNLTLGLYLYFSDECSRIRSPVTFLTALRDAGLHAGENFEPEQLYEKVRGAMQVAGIDSAENVGILQEWHKTGRYSIQGHLHRFEGEHVQGAYAKLAKALMKPYRHLFKDGRAMGVNRAVSYVLGHKQNELEDKSPEEIYADVMQIARSDAQIEHYVSDGHEMRDEVMRDIMRKKTPQGAEAEAIRAKQKEWEPMKRDVLASYPDTALRLLLLTKQTMAYSDAGNIRQIYPKGPIAGLNIKDVRLKGRKNPRNGSGARFLRYPVMLFANGYHPEDASRELNNMRLVQSSLHELMHVAQANMDKATEAMLYDHVTALETAALPEKDAKLQTLDRNSLSEVLLASSELYKGYKAIGDRAGKTALTHEIRNDEILCNLYGLMHSEFANRADPNNPVCNGKYPAVTQLAEALDAAFDQTVARMAVEAERAKRRSTDVSRA